MSSKVAPDCLNALQCVRMRACRLGFASRAQVCKAPDKDSTSFDKYLAGMNVAPLKEAYVLFLPLEPVSRAGATGLPITCGMLLARVDAQGALLGIEEAEIDAPVPADDANHLLVFQSGRYYLWFWTFSKQLFKEVVAVARSKPSEATSRYEFDGFQVMGQYYQAPPTPKNFHPDLELLLNHDCSDSQYLQQLSRIWVLQTALFRSPSLSDFAGSLMGRHINWALGNDAFESADEYLFARCRALDAMYLTELLLCHATAGRERTAADFGTFAQARDVGEKTAGQQRVAEFDEAIKINRDKYYEYAYRAANDTRVIRKDFAKSVVISVNNCDWQDAAIRIIIATNGDVWHPFLDNDGQITTEGADRGNWVLANAQPILRYFDFYRFGVDNDAKISAVERVERELQERFSALRADLKTFVARTLTYDALLADLHAHAPANFAARKELHQRYLDLALDVEYLWWKDFEVEKEKAWEQTKKLLEWVGTSTDKISELWGEHFNSLETVEKYNEAMHGNVEAIEQMMGKLNRYNQRLGGKTVVRKLRDKPFEIRADASTGEVVLSVEGKKVQTLNFFIEVGEKTEERLVPITKRRPGRVKKTFKMKKVTTKIETYHVEHPPAKEWGVWPEWFTVAGETLNLIVSVKELYDTLTASEQASTSEKVMVFAKVARDVFQVADGLSTALHASLKYAGSELGLVSRLRTLSELCKGPGLVLEAAINVHDGAVILMLGEESASAKAALRGDEIEGWLQESKGLILVASAAPGVAAAAAGLAAGETAAVALGAALPPLGVALAVAGVGVVAIELAIYIHKGPSNIMEPLQDAFNAAFVRESDERRTCKFVEQMARDAAAILGRGGAAAPALAAHG